MKGSRARQRGLAAKAGAVFSLVLIAAAVAAVVWRSGVVQYVSTPHAQVDSALSVKPAVRPKIMPDLIGKDLQSAATTLTALGLKVTIVVPARSTGLLSKADSSGESTELVLPEVRVTFPGSAPDAQGWNQSVSRQQPDPGTPYNAGMNVVLIAGQHEGASLADTWFSSHSAVTDAKGVTYCTGCHTYDWCVRCHMLYAANRPVDRSNDASQTAP